ncbi:MAG: hypothetical protein ACH344_06495, partial [Yersinia sp. (in: enterobacteria)]
PELPSPCFFTEAVCLQNGHFTSILAIRIPLIKTGSLSDDHRIEYVTPNFISMGKYFIKT